MSTEKKKSVATCTHCKKNGFSASLLVTLTYQLVSHYFWCNSSIYLANQSRYFQTSLQTFGAVNATVLYSTREWYTSLKKNTLYGGLGVAKKHDKKKIDKELHPGMWKLNVSSYESCSYWLLRNGYLPVQGIQSYLPGSQLFSGLWNFSITFLAATFC